MLCTATRCDRESIDERTCRNRVQSQPGAAQGLTPRIQRSSWRKADSLWLISDSKTTGSKMLNARRTSPLFVLNLQYKSSPLWDTDWRLGGCASCQPTEPRAVSSERESSDRLSCSVGGPQLVSTASAIQWFSVAKHAHASIAHVSLRCTQQSSRVQRHNGLLFAHPCKRAIKQPSTSAITNLCIVLEPCRSSIILR